MSRPYTSRLFRSFVVFSVCLAVLEFGSLVSGGQRRTFPPENFVVLITASTTVEILALVIAAFLALGRYRVLRDSTSWWIGVGCASFAASLGFRLLSYPFLPGGASLTGGRRAALRGSAHSRRLSLALACWRR